MASNFSSCLKPSAVQSFLGVSIFYLAPFFFFFSLLVRNLLGHIVYSLLPHLRYSRPFCSRSLWNISAVVQFYGPASAYCIMYHTYSLNYVFAKFSLHTIVIVFTIQSLILSKIHLNTEQAYTFGRKVSSPLVAHKLLPFLQKILEKS